MSFQTVLSIVGIAFTAFELYQRFRQKDSSGKCLKSDLLNNSGAPSRTKTQRSSDERNHDRAKRRGAKRRGGEGLTNGAPSVQKSEWFERSTDQRFERSTGQRSIIIIYFFLATKMSEQNKLVKMVTDSAVLVGLSAGVGYLAKKILKENFLGDPSSNVMNYAKFTGVLAGSMALKTYLEDQKILPKSI